MMPVGKIPLVDQLLELLGLSIAPVKIKSAFRAATLNWRKSSVTSDGRNAVDLVDWQCSATQNELGLLAANFLQDNNNAERFWSSERTWKHNSSLFYPAHEERITELLVQLFFRQNRSYKNNTAHSPYSKRAQSSETVTNEESHQRVANTNFTPSEITETSLQSSQRTTARDSTSREPVNISKSRVPVVQKEGIAEARQPPQPRDIYEIPEDDDTLVVQAQTSLSNSSKRPRSIDSNKNKRSNKKQKRHLREPKKASVSEGWDDTQFEKILDGNHPEDGSIVMDAEGNLYPVRPNERDSRHDLESRTVATTIEPNSYINGAMIASDDHGFAHRTPDGSSPEVSPSYTNDDTGLRSQPGRPQSRIVILPINTNSSVSSPLESPPIRMPEACMISPPASTSETGMKATSSTSLEANKGSRAPGPHQAYCVEELEDADSMLTAASLSNVVPPPSSEASVPTAAGNLESGDVVSMVLASPLPKAQNQNTVVVTVSSPNVPGDQTLHAAATPEHAEANVPDTDAISTGNARPGVQLKFSFCIMTRQPRTCKLWGKGRFHDISLPEFVAGVTAEMGRGNITKLELTLRTTKGKYEATVEEGNLESWDRAMEMFKMKVKVDKKEAKEAGLDTLAVDVEVVPFFVESVIAEEEEEEDEDPW